MARSLSRTNTLLLLAGGLSFVAVAAGAWVCAQNAVPTGLWLRNLIAWVAGGMMAVGLARLSRRGPFPVVLAATALAVAASFLSRGQMGVHRWVSLGPLSINAAAVTLPAALVALAAIGRGTWWSWVLALACLAILVAQPDGSQATAFGAALAWIALRRNLGAAAKAAVLLSTTTLVAGAWLRPDPLQPVPEVEQILQLAYRISPAIGAVALGSLIMFALAPGLIAREGPVEASVAGEALSLYLLISALAPFIGAFPVPLVGVGLSPVLGSWLGVGLLAALLRTNSNMSPPASRSTLAA